MFLCSFMSFLLFWFFYQNWVEKWKWLWFRCGKLMSASRHSSGESRQKRAQGGVAGRVLKSETKGLRGAEVRDKRVKGCWSQKQKGSGVRKSQTKELRGLKSETKRLRGLKSETKGFRGAESQRQLGYGGCSRMGAKVRDKKVKGCWSQRQKG